jgi:glucose-1-phosphate cytidylyltransferase
MKAVILAGGQGQRFREERLLRPKPLVEIANVPLIVHVMESFAAGGVGEFVLALGYRAKAN